MRILASERRMYEIPQGSYQNPKKKGMGGGWELKSKRVSGFPTYPPPHKRTPSPPVCQSHGRYYSIFSGFVKIIIENFLIIILGVVPMPSLSACGPPSSRASGTRRTAPAS